MAKLLMITGLGSARDIASDKKGAFYYTLEEFHKYWDRVDIICPRVKSEKLKVKSLFGNVFLHISPWPLLFHPLFFISTILRLHRKVNFELMTVQEFPPFYNGVGAWIISVLTKIPYVLEIMHIPGYPKAANFKEWFYKLLMKLFIKLDANRAKAVRVINKKETPNFLVKAGVPRQKLVYIPASYIDLNIFKPQEIEKKYDVIFVGRTEANKGIDLFLNMVRKTGLKAVVVGSGSLKDTVRSKVKNWKLKIDMHGWAKNQMEIAELLNRSKILIMPSYNEGGPRVVLEAMACGVPVLATPVGIIPDIIKDKESGRIIDWNSEDMAEKTLELLDNASDYKLFQKNGIEIVKQFEKEGAVRNYAEKIKSFLINK